MAMVLGIIMTMAIGCGTAEDGYNNVPQNPIVGPEEIGENPAPNPSDTENVSVAIEFTDEYLSTNTELAEWMALKEAEQTCEESGNICPQLVTGAPPVQIFGTLVSQDAWEDDTRWNPWDTTQANVRDVSAFVSGNVLTMSFTVPVGRYYHLGYIVQGVMMFHNISVNGTTINSFCTLGDPVDYWTWGVAAFKVNRLSDGSIVVEESEFCSETGYNALWTLSGVSQDNPLYSDSPSVLPYDDGADGDDEGPIMMSSNLIYNSTPVEITNFNAASARYEADFYLLEGMASRFACYHPGREVTGSADVPCADQKLTLTPLPSGTAGASQELRHAENFQTTLPAYYEFTLNGITSGVLDQDANNRDTVLGI